MSDSISIETDRLTLTPLSLEVAIAMMFRNQAVVSELLGIDVPASWFELAVRDFLPQYIKQLESDPANFCWGTWIMIHPVDRRLIGNLGFHGAPNFDRTVEMGYEIIPDYRRQGYTSEATIALVKWALTQPQINRIFAQCHVENIGSIKILEKVGMQRLWQDGDRWQWQIKR